MIQEILLGLQELWQPGKVLNRTNFKREKQNKIYLFQKINLES